MLGIGFGRHTPQNLVEMWAATISVMLGATFYALFIGQMATLLLAVDASGRIYTEKVPLLGFKQKFKEEFHENWVNNQLQSWSFCILTQLLLILKSNYPQENLTWYINILGSQTTKGLILQLLEHWYSNPEVAGSSTATIYICLFNLKM